MEKGCCLNNSHFDSTVIEKYIKTTAKCMINQAYDKIGSQILRLFINPRHICCYYLISHNNHVTCDSCPDAFGTNLGTFHFFSEKLWGFSCYNLFKHLWTLLEGCLLADLFIHVVRRWWTQGSKFLSWIRMAKYFLLFLSFGPLDSEVKCTHIADS